MRTRSTPGRGRAIGVAALSALFVSALVLSPRALASSGLPDGRVYELVSPPEKNGNEAGIESTETSSEKGFAVGYAVAGDDGGGIFYRTTGPFGETNSGIDKFEVAHRSGSGWSNRAAVPPAQGADAGNFLDSEPKTITPAGNLDSFLFFAAGFTSSAPPSAFGLFLAPEEQLGEYHEPAWVSEPTIPFGEARPEPAGNNYSGPIFGVVGTSPDLSTVYFNAAATLVPEDASRAPNVDPTSGNGPAGFYEWHAGRLVSAAQLPDGTYSPYGATAAATYDVGFTLVHPNSLDNEVSTDGSKAFFLSPDPAHAAEAGTPTELYLREHTASGPRSILVSRDELKGGAPAEGSGGEQAVTPVPTGWQNGVIEKHSYLYASPDGSRAFFASSDRLAKDPSGHEPEGSGPWMYEFNLASERVTYLPGVTGPILISSRDGSRFVAERQEPRPAEGLIRQECEEGFREGPECEPLAPAALDVSSGGHLSEIARWSAPSVPSFPAARATADGSVFVFATNAVLTGAKSADGSEPANNSGVHEQVYRYATASGELPCVSCPGPGAQPLEGTQFSRDDSRRAVLSSSGISADGGRVFFDTPQPLAPGDVNGVQDVYEWEGGALHLISSGTSQQPSFFLDNSESGADAFFITAEGLVAGDADESYDVYDARVGGGFPREAPAAPCVSQCRPAGPAPSLSAPISTATGPSGNLAPPSAAPPAGRVKLIRRSVKGHVATIVLHLPTSGRLTLSGQGLRRVAKTVARAGDMSLRVALTRAEIASLRHRRAARALKLTVQFTPTAGSRSTAVTTLSFR